MVRGDLRALPFLPFLLLASSLLSSLSPAFNSINLANLDLLVSTPSLPSLPPFPLASTSKSSPPQKRTLSSVSRGDLFRAPSSFSRSLSSLLGPSSPQPSLLLNDAKRRESLTSRRWSVKIFSSLCFSRGNELDEKKPTKLTSFLPSPPTLSSPFLSEGVGKSTIITSVSPPLSPLILSSVLTRSVISSSNDPS